MLKIKLFFISVFEVGSYLKKFAIPISFSGPDKFNRFSPFGRVVSIFGKSRIASFRLNNWPILRPIKLFTNFLNCSRNPGTRYEKT
jgi:hypothetical protein